MADTAIGANDFRDWFNDYNRTNGSKPASGANQQWDAVFEEEKQMVSVDDFLNLMVAQLQNQDFMNPVDDTQYVTQLAQFATMQQMQELASYMKTNYALSLAGKNVTAAKFTVGGAVKTETGPIQKISLVDNSYEITVNGETFSLSQIMEINDSKNSASGSGSSSTDNRDQTAYLVSLMGRYVTVQTGSGKDDILTGQVTRVSTSDGKYRLMIGGEWYELKSVTDVYLEKPGDENPEESTGGENPGGSGTEGSEGTDTAAYHRM